MVHCIVMSIFALRMIRVLDDFSSRIFPALFLCYENCSAVLEGL